MARRSRGSRASRSSSAASDAGRARRRGGRLLAVLLILAAAGIVAIGGWLVRSRGFTSSSAGGPIVLISIDTLRADRLPAYGYRGVSTPAIDALAADGVLFERAYAHSPQTLPSHASILSGQLPFEHGVRDNVGFTVRKGQPVLPEMLRSRGYRTGGFASAFIMRKESGIGQGFEVYDADTPPTPAATFGTVRRDGALTLDAAERWLNGLQSDRFFLFLHLYEPHKPYRPPARYAHYPHPYDGTVAYSDELVGRLVQTLKDRGVYDRATIVLLSDHGEGLGDHGEQEHGVFLYDSTIRVPLIVKLASSRHAGKRVASPVEHIDIVPTLLDVAGMAAAPGLRGLSLLQAIGGRDARLADRGIYSETLYPLYHFGWSPLYALTDPRYRFILAPRPELYDLARDAGQTHNVHGERAQTAASMQMALDRLVSGRGIDQPAATSGADVERFQALGYIGSARVPVALEKGGLPDPKDKVHVLEQYRLGVDLRSERRYAEAAEAFRRVLTDSPTMIDVWAQLSQVLAAQGMKREAVNALARAVSLDPDLVDNRIALAAAQIDVGQLDEAEGNARHALDSKPGVAHELLARIALRRGNEAEGLAEARLATDADPNLAFPLYVQGIAEVKAGRHEEAVSLFRRAIAALRARKVALAGLHMATADALARLNRYDEAEAEFKAEIAIFPGNAQARVGLAMLYRSQGRVREAAGTLAEMLRTSPTPASYVMAARTFQVLGDAEAARDVVARGLRQFPGNRELLAIR